jgi:hypothetical protein
VYLFNIFMENCIDYISKDSSRAPVLQKMRALGLLFEDDLNSG